MFPPLCANCFLLQLKQKPIQNRIVSDMETNVKWLFSGILHGNDIFLIIT